MLKLFNNESFKYQGDELVLFQHAKNWKKYFSKKIIPFIQGNVLEAGAGLGATTLLLNNGTAPKWLLLEPDEKLCEELRKKITTRGLPANCQLQTGTINALSEKFDTIIYIDVLEHIEADNEEMLRASTLLNSGGHLIVLSPAFQHLFNPFDKAIGHYRRYTKKTLKKLSPAGMKVVSCKYYDTAGYLAALVNKIFLHQKYPTIRQVLFWDRWMIPLSRITDNLIFHSFGKSIIGIWRKETVN